MTMFYNQAFPFGEIKKTNKNFFINVIVQVKISIGDIHAKIKCKNLIELYNNYSTTYPLFSGGYLERCILERK